MGVGVGWYRVGLAAAAVADGRRGGARVRPTPLRLGEGEIGTDIHVVGVIGSRDVGPPLPLGG